MTPTPTAVRRTVSLSAPHRLRITVNGKVTEYDIEIWRGPHDRRVIELRNRATGTVYRITVQPYGRKHQLAWTCDCPDSRRRHHACKHVLALRTGLRRAGYRV